MSFHILKTPETAAQKKIISLLLEIKEEQQRQWTVLKDLQAMIQGHMCEEDVETLDIDLPLQTMEQLDETERYLENDEAQKRMVKPNKKYWLFMWHCILNPW